MPRKFNQKSLQAQVIEEMVNLRGIKPDSMDGQVFDIM